MRIKITTFGQALRLLREERGLSYREVQERSGCSKQDVKNWEMGLSYPSGNQLTRLHKMCFHRLRFFLHLIPEHYRSAATQPDEPDEIGGSQEAERDLEATLPEPKTFGEALKRERVHEGLNQDELGELVGVVGQAVSQWETDGASPIHEHFVKLCDLFPDLKTGPQPDPRKIPKPDGGKGQQRDHLTIRGSDSKLPAPGLTISSSSAPSADSPPPAQAPRIYGSVTAIMSPAKPMLTPFERAGATYARTLHDRVAARSRLDEAERELEKARHTLEEAEKQVKIAHDHLLQVVATTMPAHESRKATP